MSIIEKYSTKKNHMKWTMNPSACLAFLNLGVIEELAAEQSEVIINEGVIKHLDKLRSSHIMTVDEIKSGFPYCVKFATRYGPWPPLPKQGLLLKGFRTACTAAALLRDRGKCAPLLALGDAESSKNSREDDEMIVIHLNDLRDHSYMDTQELTALFPYCVEFAKKHWNWRTADSEVEKVDAETPHEVRERLLSLPEAGEATQLLRELERMRTDVLHAQNAIEGVPKHCESFAVRLRRMNRQGKIPDEIFRQVLVVSRFRNRAVYECYHLQSDEVEAVDKAFDAIGKWTHKVGYIY